ncbi:hypothetical protein BN946_scf184473.g13 [Trametes cinnabarina]|uniref:Heterokaryon incompatibility domain-containing protein n=1 Tax=Pycnoporus cinnabarinus TaxID=5643 RepID=A0A060SXT3_PYCCI|nr:hypothetical protein BN946_scf184473.g13 [Trametes cinnabarina]
MTDLEDTPSSTDPATQRHPGLGATQVGDASKDAEPRQPSEPGKMELRLMVETAISSSEAPSIFVDDRYWTLSEPLDIESEPVPPYICVSYVWGDGRVTNPIHPSSMMSDRTLGSFTAAACQYRGGAGSPIRIWMDAFCVPVERAKKRATLESLGFIFAHAQAVVAVLAPQSIAAVEEMEAFLALQPGPEEVPNAPIAALDEDEWIRSVWTYQEIVNSKAIRIVSYPRAETTAPQKSYSDHNLLNIIGDYLNRWGHSKTGVRYGIRLYYPHADNFQEILVDWTMAAYTQRSALQIMSGLDHRAHVLPENHFYSMLGALTDRPSPRATNPSIEQLAERFMQLCEEKGDYSFIFCAASRDRRPGFRWRPMPCLFPTMIPWHCYGDGQVGMRLTDGVLLKNVLVFSVSVQDQRPHPLNPKTRRFLSNWLGEFQFEHTFTVDDEDEILLEATYNGLTMLHFRGRKGAWYCTESGVFFALEKLPQGETTLAIAVGVRWTFGAPGMAQIVVNGENEYIPGVFCGPDLHTIEPSTLLLR